MLSLANFKPGPLTKRHLLPAAFAISFSILAVPTLLSRRPPAEFTDFKLKQQQVAQGEKLGLMYGYKYRYTPCNAEIYLTLFDQTEMLRQYVGILDESFDPPEDAGPEKFSGIVKYIGVPVHAAEGSGTLQGYVVFRCSFIHEWWPIVKRIPRQEFTITKRVDKEVESLRDQLDRELPPPPPLPKEILEPPFRTVPLPSPSPLPKGGFNAQPKKRAVRRRDKDKARVVSKTLATSTSTQMPPFPKEELPSWLKWMANQ